MHTIKVEELDETFQREYKTIMRSANTICKSYSNSTVTDVVHNAYLKLRRKVERDGFQGDNMMGYIWVSIRNEYGMELRKEKRNKTVFMHNIHYNDVDYSSVVERVLLEQDEIIKSSQQYDNDLMDITRELFEYVELIFDPKETYLFKNYYLTPKSTYKKLAARTGYSIMDCSIIMKSMKKRIREGFIPYYKAKYNE